MLRTMVEDEIGLAGTVVVLDFVEQRRDIAPANAKKFTVAPNRQHVASPEALRSLGATEDRWLQRAASSSWRRPLGTCRASASGPRMRGKPSRMRSIADRARMRASSTPRRSVAPMRCPNLLAVRIAGDGNERLCAARLNANVVATKFGIRFGIASRSRLQSGNTDVGKALTTRHETPSWLTVG